MIYNNIIELIGNTPIVKLNQFNDDIADIYIKLERYNPGFSVKDRAALGMIEDAEQKGILNKDSVLVEPTSGNTGISIAMIGRVKGYKVILTMPDSMSIERRAILKSFGAELILTDATFGMKGAIEKAQELIDNNDNYIMLQQFNNEANSLKHYNTTAEEIIKDLPDINAFVAGVGTSGTISGVGKKLKEYNNSIEIIAVEPFNSAVISGEDPGKHSIQGIGAGFIPKILDKTVIDNVIKITDEEAFKFARELSLNEGLFLGISSGANLAAAVQIAKKLGKGKKVLTISPDGGEKYLSTALFK